MDTKRRDMFKNLSIIVLIALVAYICVQTVSVEAGKGKNPFKAFTKWAKGEGGSRGPTQQHDDDSDDDEPLQTLDEDEEYHGEQSSEEEEPTTTPYPIPDLQPRLWTYWPPPQPGDRMRRDIEVEARMMEGYPWTTSTTTTTTPEPIDISDDEYTVHDTYYVNPDDD